MSFPYSSRREMLDAGWRFETPSRLSECRSCGRSIEWSTSPRGKRVPLNPSSTVIHFKTCAPSATSNASLSPPWPEDHRNISELAQANNTSLPAAQQLVAALHDCASAVRELLAELQARRSASAPRATSRV